MQDLDADIELQTATVTHTRTPYLCVCMLTKRAFNTDFPLMWLWGGPQAFDVIDCLAKYYPLTLNLPGENTDVRTHVHTHTHSHMHNNCG